jgi:hypothetical protein
MEGIEGKQGFAIPYPTGRIISYAESSSDLRPGSGAPLLFPQQQVGTHRPGVVKSATPAQRNNAIRGQEASRSTQQG